MTEIRYVQKSITVGIESSTLEDMEAARVAVGAPENARVNTSGGFFEPDYFNAEFPFYVTFSWYEELA